MPTPTSIPDASDPSEGAICRDCRQNMLVAEGCTARFVADQTGTVYTRIPWGQEAWFDGYETIVAEQERCGDCGTQKGHIHHFRCDMEKCPICGEQMLKCAFGGSNHTVKPIRRAR